MGAFSQVIPGMSDRIPARLTVWGEEIVLPGGTLRQWLPYKASEIKNDPVEVELERLTFYPGMPGKNVTINKKKVEFPDGFYRDYLLTFGNRAKQAMLKVISSGRYKRATDDIKRKMLDRRLTQIRRIELQKAKNRFRRDFS